MLKVLYNNVNSSRIIENNKNSFTQEKNLIRNNTDEMQLDWLILMRQLIGTDG